MKVRYFEKRGNVWADFRLDGIRKRVDTGARWPDEKAGAAALPGIIARIARAEEAGATAAAAAATAPAPRTVASGHTLESAFKLAMRVRPQWMQAKDKASLQTTFDSIVASSDKLTADTDMALLDRDFVRELRAVWLASPGKRKDTTLSASTVNHRLSMLSVLLEVCDLLPHNVKHLSTKGNARHRRVTDEEFRKATEWASEQAILGRSGCEEFHRLLLAGLDTGARLSELLDLEPSDISGSTATFRDTKNALTRTIPLRAGAKAGLLVGSGKRPFPTLTVDRVTTLWDLMRTPLGLAEDQRFVFHLLRHECASRFADEGKGAHFIKAWLGHENIKTSESYVNMSVGGLAAQVGVSLEPVSAQLH